MLFKIAVVDDDISNLKTVERILQFNGYKVTCLNSGEELLDFAETTKVDLILLDVHMIGMDGFETMRELRMVRYGRDVPVIFLTADDDTETETKALSAGAMDFVTKPIIDNVLLLRVRNTIELIRLQSNLRSEVRRKTEEVYQEHEKYKKLSIQVVQTIAGTIDAKDNYTRGHSSRVAKYSME
ncbi:MAG: response regulator, partial [Ruminococcus sp.]|nr:response regulator [Ruminococcus sp.]